MQFYSLSAVVSRIWNELEGGWIFDDSRLNRMQIRDEALKVRAAYLVKLFKSKVSNLNELFYNECCFEVQCVPRCAGSPHNVWRATVPAVLGELGQAGVAFVGSPDNAIQFEWQAVDISKSYSMFSPQQRKFIILGNTLELYGKPEGMTKFVLRAVFANPFACNPCPDVDAQWIPADCLDDIEKTVKLNLSNFLLQKKIDKRNNANPDN